MIIVARLKNKHTNSNLIKQTIYKRNQKIVSKNCKMNRALVKPGHKEKSTVNVK